jgi:DNA-binding LacI/PurR family transcriptional regulator
VGYDDLMFAAYTNPALTTLRMPTTEIVAEAVRSAIALARSRSTNAVREGHLTVYQPTLVVRASTAPPSG